MTPERKTKVIGEQVSKQYVPFRKCSWVYFENDIEEYWETGCGEKYSFNDGGLKENGVNYCFKCGGKIRVTE